MEFEQPENGSAIHGGIILPGKYATVLQFDGTTLVITFQSKDELEEYLDELTEGGDDEEEEEWNASE